VTSIKTGHTTTVHIGIPGSDAYQNVHVTLLDINGRIVRSVYKNHSHSDLMTMHLQNNDYKTGIFVMKIAVNNKTVFSQQIYLQ
jgi:hypothetical protein